MIEEEEGKKKRTHQVLLLYLQQKIDLITLFNSLFYYSVVTIEVLQLNSWGKITAQKYIKQCYKSC